MNVKACFFVLAFMGTFAQAKICPNRPIQCAKQKNEMFLARNRIKKLTKKKVKTIIIDPGHGGIYQGETSINKKVVEKDATLDIAHRLAKRLRKRGYHVVLTRVTDTQLEKKSLLSDLALRAEFTRRYAADAFVSLHLNLSRSKSLRGYEIYVPYESRYPIRSYSLASCVHYELSHRIKPRFVGGKLNNLNCMDHGISSSKFNVLVKAHCPAILIELDYLSNAQSESLLQTDTYKNLLAQSVFCGLCRYFQAQS